MNLVQTIKARIIQALGGTPAPAQVQAQQALPMLPAAFGGDPTLYGFRRLTGSGQDVAALRDLPLPTQDRMQELAYYLYLTNPMAKWLVNMQRAYIVGGGVTLKAEDPDVQAVLDGWWKDPVNNWPKKLPNKVRELGLYGEQCYPAFTAPGTGRVRLGYLDPTLIQEVILDPDNAEQPIGVITKQQTGVLTLPERRYRVIIPITEEELTPAAQRLRELFTDGECFYFAVNKVSNGSRGISDLLDKADWLDGYEQFLFQRLERGDLMNRIIFDLELQGFTQPQIDEFKKGFALPRPGGVHFHNEKVKLNATAPDLKANDAQTDARQFKHQAIAGFPEHWYGGGGDVNRATAGEMDEPTFKLLHDRQLDIKCLIEECGQHQIRQAKAVGVLKQTAPESFQASFPEMVTADLTKIGAVLVQVSQALAPMLLQRLLSKAEARTIFAVTVKALGVDLAELDEAALAQLGTDADFEAAAEDYLAQARRTKTRPVKLRAF